MNILLGLLFTFLGAIAGGADGASRFSILKIILIASAVFSARILVTLLHPRIERGGPWRPTLREWITLGVGILVFMSSCFFLNRASLFLGPGLLFFLLVYPYSKSFPRISPGWKGACFGIAVLWGWIATAGALNFTSILLMTVLVISLKQTRLFYWIYMALLLFLGFWMQMGASFLFLWVLFGIMIYWEQALMQRGIRIIPHFRTAFFLIWMVAEFHLPYFGISWN